jgi:O-antigen/teichoic acid export membrane protein
MTEPGDSSSRHHRFERTLLAEGGIYAVVEIAQQGMTLLTLPVLLFFMTAEDFGVVTTAVVISQVTMLIGTLGLDFSLLRLYFKWEDDERVALASGILFVSIIWCLFLTLVFVAGASRFPLIQAHGVSLLLGALAGFAQGIRNIPLSVLRVTGAMRAYAWAELGSAVVRGLLQLILVWVGFGAVGYMLGYAVGPAVSAMMSIASISSVFKWRSARLSLTKSVWVYTAKIFPSLAFNRLVAVSDRLVLFQWTTLDGLGIYGIASRFCSCLKLLTGGLKLALAPAMSRAEAERLDSRLLYSNLSRLMLLTMLSIGSALLMSVWFVQFTPWADNAMEIARLVGLLILAQLLGGLGLIWQLSFYYSSEPQAVSTAATVSAVTLFIALFSLVPSLGLTGAASAQLIAAAANIAVLATIETRRQGLLESRQELIGLSALCLPALTALWLLRPSHQLYILVPTFLIYVMMTFFALRRLWPLRPVSL